MNEEGDVLERGGEGGGSLLEKRMGCVLVARGMQPCKDLRQREQRVQRP